MTAKRPKFDPAPLMRELGKIRSKSRPVARRAVHLAAEAINSEAKSDAPRRTGFLVGTHTVDASNSDAVRLGATAAYAAAVHARHPRKAQWYLRAILQKGPKILAKALRAAMNEQHPGAAR